MLHGRRLDHALSHVNGSRYALVHAVSKRARQITLWLTADPAELRAEAAPPPVAGETITRDPVALSESEILDGEVIVRWDPDGQLDEPELLDSLETDPLLLEGLEGEDDDDDADLGADADSVTTPALAEVLDKDAEESTADAPESAADASAEVEGAPVEVPLSELDEGDDEGDDDGNDV